MKEKKNNKFVLIAVVACVSLCCLVSCCVSIFFVLNENDVFFYTSEDKKAQDYAPRFRENNLELILGNKAYLYYKTDKASEIRPGDDIGFDFIMADTGDLDGVGIKSTDERLYNLLDNKVDYVFDGYIAFEFYSNEFNADCFGIYKDGELTTDWTHRTSFGSYPEDMAYKCTEFDFENLEIK